MKKVFWYLLALGGSLSLLCALRDASSCETCSYLVIPTHLNRLLTDSVKITLPYPAPPAPELWRTLAPAQRVADAKSRLLPGLIEEVKKSGCQLGNAAFIRIFKESRELELWLHDGNAWKLFRTYPIAAMSGTLGPKLKEGDGQAPEGFYTVNQKSLNPASSYHLSFNIGYPNAYDQHHGRTGSFIMVHGNEVSIGCFAMTDPVIEEIYLLVEAALNGGQSQVAVHTFPFRMTNERMTKAKSEPAAAFWSELQPGYDAFEKAKTVPRIEVTSGRYVIRS